MYNNVKEPLYFHREYVNDFPKQDVNAEDSSQTLQVAKVALPFVALYRPLGMTLACGLSAVRTITSLKECFAAEDYQKLSLALFNTGLAVVSVVGTIFLHPLGMLITTLNDIGVNIYHVYGSIRRGEMAEAGKQTMRVANNAFYLAMLVIGSIELQVASLAVQVLIEGSSSYEEFNKGNILETIGHIGMCMVRMNQSYAQFGILQRKWNAESMKYSVQKASHLEAASVKGGKWHPALGALKEQHQGHLVYADLRVAHEDELCSFSDEVDFNLLPEVKAVGDKGDLVAVWLDADAAGVKGDLDGIKAHFAGLDKFLYTSQYDASTGLWSTPNGLAIGKEGLNWSLMSADPLGNALVLLKNDNQNTLEAVAFDSMAKSWSSRVQLADHLPNVTAFDGDALGNCTLVWNDKDNLFTARTYDANSKTWNLPVSIKNEMINLDREVIDLIVRRDQDSNIVILGELEDPAGNYTNLRFFTRYNGKDKHWFVPETVQISNRGLDRMYGDQKIVDLISMGKGQFTAVFADKRIINSMLINANSHCSYYKQIKFSVAEIDEIVVDKDRFGNPVIAWKESQDEDLEFDWELFYEDLHGRKWVPIFEKIFNSTKIHVANFDSSKNDWIKTEVASGIINDHPLLGKANGDLYLFWDEFGTPSEDYSTCPINCNGMKWDETKGKWQQLGTVFQCPMKESPFDLNYYFKKSIHDDGLQVIWKDGEDYLKKTTPF